MSNKDKLFGRDKLANDLGSAEEKIKQLENQIKRHESYESRLRSIIIKNDLRELLPDGPHV